MKQKFLSLILTLIMATVAIPMTAFGDDDFMYNMETMTEKEVTEVTEKVTSCHDSYKSLVKAMLTLVDQGIYTKKDIKNLHDFYGKLKPGEIPTTDKALLDALYSNKIITKTQYDDTLALLK